MFDLDRIRTFLRVNQLLRDGRYTRSPLALAEELSTQLLPPALHGGLPEALSWLRREEAALLVELGGQAPERAAGVVSMGSGV